MCLRQTGAAGIQASIDGDRRGDKVTGVKAVWGFATGGKVTIIDQTVRHQAEGGQWIEWAPNGTRFGNNDYYLGTIIIWEGEAPAEP